MAGRIKRPPAPVVRPAPEGAPAAPAAKAAPRATDALDRALADKRVSNAEWSKVAPELSQAPLGSPQLRALLEAYASRSIGFEVVAAEGADRLLDERGYDVPARAAAGGGLTIAPAVDLRPVLEGNAADADPVFDALFARVGDPARRISVAVVDGGFVAHPMLADNLEGNRAARRTGAALGKEFGTFTDLERSHGAHHGTHVLGIATRGTSRLQAALFAVPLEVPDDPQAASKPERKSPLPEALEAAAKSGAAVVNVSIESFVTAAEAQRYRAVMEKFPQTLFVFGAGNDRYQLGTAGGGDQTVVESFKLPNLAVVGASNPDGGRWGQSNTSEQWVDLAARGHYIASASSIGPGLERESGTSMAAPNVSNLAAKCWLLHPALSPGQVVKLLAATSDPHHSWKGQVGSGGTVNAERALRGAAALALVGKGASLAAALNTLGVSADERALLSQALPRL